MTPQGHSRWMADVKVRNLPEWVVTSLRKKAQHGPNLQKKNYACC